MTVRSTNVTGCLSVGTSKHVVCLTNFLLFSGNVGQKKEEERKTLYGTQPRYSSGTAEKRDKKNNVGFVS